MTWTFGIPPLPQTARAAERLRNLTNVVLSLEQPNPRLDRLLEMIDDAHRELVEQVPDDLSPRVGNTGGRVYLDHSRDIGAFNPCVPTYALSCVEESRAYGTVNFPVAYEGPPGIVHGGFLALFFDAVIQHHNCDVGVAGRTTELTIRYRRPTPLGTELRFALDRAVDGSRIRSTGRLSHDDTLLCEVWMDAVKGDRSRLPSVSPRRGGS